MSAVVSVIAKVTGATGTLSIACGGSTTLTVDGGFAGTGAIAEWFTDSCGGTSVGTGNSISVSPTTTTTYYVRYNGTCNTTTCGSVTVTVGSCSSIVNLKLFIEGYYTGASTMASVKNNQDGSSPLTDVENITVELHNTTSPYATAYTTTAVLKTNGTAVCTFNTAPSGSYYIAVRNSNAIETWSANPQTVGSTPLTYDFSTAVNKSYGDNMKDLGSGVFGFYSGDINQDDVIDGSDATSLDLDIFNSEFGVKVTDLNGDGSVDASDSTYYENNSYNSIFAILP